MSAEELEKQIKAEIDKINEIKEKVRKLAAGERPKNPFTLTKLCQNTNFSINLSLDMMFEFKRPQHLFEVIPLANKVAFVGDESISIFSIPLVTTPTEILFPSPTEKITTFAITAGCYALIAHFNTGDVKTTIVKDQNWSSPIITSHQKVNIQTTAAALMIQYPPNMFFLATPTLETRFNNSIGDCNIIAAELTAADPYVVFLNEKNEIYTFSFRTLNLEKKITSTFISAKFSASASHLILLKEDSIESYRSTDSALVGSVATHSKGIGVDQNFIVSVEKVPNTEVSGAVIYDFETMNVVASITIDDDEIEEIQTSFQNDMIITFRLKSGRFAVFHFRSIRAL